MYKKSEDVMEQSTGRPKQCIHLKLKYEMREMWASCRRDIKEKYIMFAHEAEEEEEEEEVEEEEFNQELGWERWKLLSTNFCLTGTFGISFFSQGVVKLQWS